MRIAIAAALVMSAASATAASPVVADAENRVLGFYYGRGEVSDRVQVVSTLGYTVTYVRATGQVTPEISDPWGNSGSNPSVSYYQSADCMGSRYLEAPAGFTGGGVGQVNETGVLLYVEKNATSVSFLSQSRLTDTGVCEVGNFHPGPFMEALENDPTVTGVSNEPSTPPLKVEVAEVSGSSFELFRDGFESAVSVQRWRPYSA